MPLKNKIVIFIVYTIVIVAFTRFLTPTKVKTETKTVSVDKIVYKDKIVKDERLHKHILITKTQEPNGNIVTKTDITYDMREDTTKDDALAKDDTKTSDTTKVVTHDISKFGINLLGGYDFTKQVPTYGVSITKQVFGPFTIGLFGLNNSTAGASFGLTF